MPYDLSSPFRNRKYFHLRRLNMSKRILSLVLVMYAAFFSSQPSLATDGDIESASPPLEDGRYRASVRVCDYLVSASQEKIYMEPTNRGADVCGVRFLAVFTLQPDGTYTHENGYPLEIINSRSFLATPSNVIFRKISN
jgi:hypothetical protein